MFGQCPIFVYLGLRSILMLRVSWPKWANMGCCPNIYEEYMIGYLNIFKGIFQTAQHFINELIGNI